MKYIIFLSPLFLGVVTFEFYNYFAHYDVDNLVLAFISSAMMLYAGAHEYTSEQIEFSRTARFFISTCFATLPFLGVYIFYPAIASYDLLAGLGFICGTYFLMLIIQVYFYRSRYRRFNSTLMRSM
ncbi:MAG: hypothetical protein CMO01_12360 [Thalassobius sp.]|nr:hypothetical protein [Thalassovita sp.]